MFFVLILQANGYFDYIFWDVDDCESVMCQNDGSCVDGVNSFTCICTAGFTGKYCQTGL